MEKNDIASSVTPEHLTSLLRRATENQSVQIREWDTQRLKGGLEYGSSIYRLTGSALVEGEDRNWSLILKIVQPEVKFDDAQGFCYWKRELLAYQSGLLQELPGQIIAPRCYDIHQNPDGSAWIWMEEVMDEQEHPWTIDRYTQVARHLGQFNGSYLVGHPMPGEAWIARDWLHKYLLNAASMVEFIRQNPAHPTVQLALPGINLRLSLALWDESPRLLRVLDALPQTFCHQDAFGRNLFYRSGQVVAIDWGFAGIAPVGAELAPLIGAAFGLARFPSNQAAELDQACFSGYLEGLRESGWETNPQQVRLGYTITVVLRYILGATIGQVLPGLMDERTHDHWVEGLETSEERAGENDPGIIAYYQSIFMEAMKLLGLRSQLSVVGKLVTHTIRLGGKRRAKYSG